MAMVLVLTSLVAPMFNTGGKLTSSGNQIATLVEQARPHAMSKNVLTALILNTDADTAGAYRAFVLLEYNAEDEVPQWKQLSQWQNLPTGVVVDTATASSFLSDSPDPLPFTTSSPLPVNYQGVAVDGYAARVFLPSGALSNPGIPAKIQLVEGDRQGSGTSYTRPTASGGAANWYRIAIIGSTGRGKIERP
jgi:hypothetical protein